MKYYLNLERPHLMNPAINIIVKADFRGKFHEDVFRDAVKQLSETYEILRATVQMDEKGRAYYKPCDAADVPVELLEGGASFEQLVQRENKRRFCLDRESMLRVFAIPAPSAFSVIFVCHHLLGDGKSSFMLMESLIRIYKGEKLPFVKIHLMKGEEDLPKNSQLSVLPKIYLSNLNRKWKKEEHIFSYDEFDRLFQVYHREREPQLHSLTLNAVELRRLAHRCKKIGVTLNSAVVAAFTYARKEIDEHHKNSQDIISVAVDIRDKLSFDAGRLIGNYASAVSIEQGAVGKDTFARFMGKIHNKLKEKITNDKARWIWLQAVDWLEGTFWDAQYFTIYEMLDSKAVKSFVKKKNYLKEPRGMVVTNLGKLILKMPEGIELESLELVPPATAANDITVGVVTYQEVMHMAIMYEPTAVRKETIQKICNRVKELLLTDGE